MGGVTKREGERSGLVSVPGSHVLGSGSPPRPTDRVGVWFSQRHMHDGMCSPGPHSSISSFSSTGMTLGDNSSIIL